MSLREVGVGKPFATITAALTDLFAVVGSNVFVEPHMIRVFNGTYAETATPNTLLNPTSNYRLILEVASLNTATITGSGVRAYGINIGTIDYVSVSGFSITACTTAGLNYTTSHYAVVSDITSFSNTGNGILTSGSNYATIYNCICYSNAGSTGIYIGSSSNYATVYNCRCYSNGASGIRVYSNSNYFTGYNNTIYSNVGFGISFITSANGTVYSNHIYSNPTGIYFAATSPSAKVYNNILRLNSVGISFDASINCSAYNNTLYLNGTNGISFSGISTGGIVKNNIIWNNAGYGISVVTASQVGFISNYNNIHKTGTGGVGFWGITGYSTLALWQAATGDDYNSISLDPLFISAGGVLPTDYKVTVFSPTINIGTNLSLIFTTDYAGTSRIQWDLGAYVYLNIGIPVISNQVVSNYNPTQDLIITAEANISGTPEHAAVKMNDIAFKLWLVAGDLYRAIIPAYQIGLCANKPVYFLATNTFGGTQATAPSNITVSVNGNYDIAIIETAIINLIITYCPLIKTAINYERKLIPELPAITLWYDGFDQTQTEAVSYTINHKWIMRLYVRLNDAKVAQDDVKALTKSILSAFKSNLSLSGTVLKETIPSAIVSAVLDQNNPVLIVEFNLTTMTEED